MAVRKSEPTAKKVPLNADQDQFIIPEELEFLLGLLAPYNQMAEPFIPDGGIYNISDGNDPGEKQFLLRFKNNFVSSAALLLNEYNRSGERIMVQRLFNTMIFHGCNVDWWEYDKVK
jgi:hypothetical protein